MFATLKSRLTLFACGAWIFGAYLVADAYSPSVFGQQIAWALVTGWLALIVCIYGAFWVVEGNKGSIATLPTPMPRWVAYVLIGVMAILIMGLPKALFG